MKINNETFGVLSDGTKVNLYTISNGKMSFSCTDYGATLTSIVLFNDDGTKTDVLCGYSTFDDLIKTRSFFGVIVGRFANRIGNAKFMLNGKEYNLDKNDGKNTLHGGFTGYDKAIWCAKKIKVKNAAGIKFSRLSKDGEQGFPGNVKIDISYLLDKNNNLTCYYTAQTDKDTPINITNHAFFNLAGKGTVENHLLQMNSTKYLEVDSGLIPTGKFIDVKDTPFDFTTEKLVGKDIKLVGPGYDHCYVTEIYDPENPQCGLPLDCSDLVNFAKVKDPSSGHVMEVFTNLEGCQFYSGNYIGGTVGKNGTVYNAHDALCLETQCFPDTPNKKEFPSCILKTGQTMKAKTVYSFYTEN